ncbi:MAG TPA: cupin-like domain-containing protein [Pyrinomonadaceae bacterium]|nr:cupin-like domain-containing protein [Pyrinomonadaceae bacterium]
MSKAPPTIERLERPSPDEFYERYVARNRPAILTGVAASWPALSRWTPQYFRAAFADVEINYVAWQSDAAANDPADYLRTRKKLATRLGAFVEMMSSGGDVSRNYVAQFPIFRAVPRLEQDVEPLDAYMKIPAFYPPALRRRLVFEPRLWMGTRGTVTTLHFDSADNFLAQIHGRKKLVLVSPEQSGAVYYPCHELGHVIYSPVDVEEPDFDKFPLFKEATPLEFTLEPGEILFIPVRWWHYARSLDESISLNFWWWSLHSLLKMRHPYLIHKKRRLFERLRSRLKK